MRVSSILILAVSMCALLAAQRQGRGQDVRPWIKPEQQQIQFRSPQLLPPIAIQDSTPPPTVTDPQPDRQIKHLSLDEAIAIALRNSEVVRVLAGSTAVSGGRTVYDAAIQNTTIDQRRAEFDPQLVLNQSFDQNESAFANIISSPVIGAKTSGYQLGSDLSQKNMTGGTGRIGISSNLQQLFPRNAANPNDLARRNNYSTEVSYTQPLLAGAGVEVNRVPIVLARLDTERSYFQFNDAIQELVRGVVEAYWAVVFARTDVWARRIQTQQSAESLKRSEKRIQVGFANITETSQIRAALARFKANLIAAEANVIQREAALQNIIGLPPNTSYRIVPITMPTTEPIDFDWNTLVRLAADRRPDLIELKLILEADRQSLILADNRALPSLDAVALYRWDGLQGRFAASRSEFATRANDYTDWSLGINFSVPLYLRSERAQVRSVQLQIARDKANIEQGMHQVRHQLAQNARNLAQFYAQWQAFQDAREASKNNLERQIVALREGFEDAPSTNFLNFLNALTDWGNSVSQEAQSLAQYNTELVTLERQTGTILETHGVFFHEDRFCSVGPKWWQANNGREYPRNLRPGENQARYSEQDGDQPAENAFDLDDYPERDATRGSNDDVDKKNQDLPNPPRPLELPTPENKPSEPDPAAPDPAASDPAASDPAASEPDASDFQTLFELQPLK